MTHIHIAKEGWGRSTDSNLSIAYQDGYLYDIGTTYGYGPGQTAWQDRVRDYYRADYESYQKSREETIRREENEEEAFWAAARAENERVMKELHDFNRLRLVSSGENAQSELVYQNKYKSRLLEILERVWRDGLAVPLTDKVISLRGESGMVNRFDQKA